MNNTNLLWWFDVSWEKYISIILDQIYKNKQVISDIYLNKWDIQPFLNTHLNRVVNKKSTEILLEKTDHIYLESIELSDQLMRDQIIIFKNKLINTLNIINNNWGEDINLYDRT